MATFTNLDQASVDDLDGIYENPFTPTIPATLESGKTVRGFFNDENIDEDQGLASFQVRMSDVYTHDIDHRTVLTIRRPLTNAERVYTVVSRRHTGVGESLLVLQPPD